MHRTRYPRTSDADANCLRNAWQAKAGVACDYHALPIAMLPHVWTCSSIKHKHVSTHFDQRGFHLRAKHKSHTKYMWTHPNALASGYHEGVVAPKVCGSARASQRNGGCQAWSGAGAWRASSQQEISLSGAKELILFAGRTCKNVKVLFIPICILLNNTDRMRNTT